ncbi:MAG TPA: hypothetical protein VES67_26280 [Vicinamibacterales bacterium]|nr:hypothetical protein [Vicinamibacterales bacterium]
MFSDSFQELTKPAGVMRAALGAADVGARLEKRTADPDDRAFEVGDAHDRLADDGATNSGNRHTYPRDATSLPMGDREDPRQVRHAATPPPRDRGIVRNGWELSGSPQNRS